MELQCICKQLFGINLYSAICKNITDEENGLLVNMCYELVEQVAKDFPIGEEFYTKTTYFGHTLKDERRLDFLRDQITTHVKIYLEAMNVDFNVLDIEVDRMWFNINRKGEFHLPHVHRNTTFAGVYYIDVPDDSSLMFMNPIPRFVSFPKMNPSTSNGQEIDHIERVTAKTLLLFDGWVIHCVPPNRSTKDRLCIAFNVNVNPKPAS